MSNSLQDQLTLSAEGLHAAGQAALRARSAEAFGALEQAAGRFDGAVREAHQAATRNAVQGAMRALSAGAPLSDADRNAVRDVIVGDAAAYLQHQDHVNEWLAELTRLLDEILERCGSSDAATDRALRGATRESVRLIAQLRAYFDDQHRLEQFDQATARLDAPNRELLLSVLREKLSSPSR
ncbi:MAG: hypothetical protein U1A27_06800 [Phycisphaerae bacterium]